ncbi:MAG TPA: DUF3159 domain-containing protein [Anaerolineales bacterium]|nr:DUF3159 domain-containing protein [Anaerolineales bacterium]
MDKLNELWDELKLVFSGRGPGIIDALIPLLVFIVGSRFLGLNMAVVISLGVAGAVMVFRLFKRQSLAFAAGGGGSALLAGFFAYLSGSASGFYLPGFITGGLTIVGCVLSAFLKRPLAAYSSMLTRRWPANWYWHPKVLPAYREVTLFWGILFGIRLVVELFFFTQNEIDALGTVRLVMGWPYTVLVLVASYLYGQKRLANLAGPSVEEFKSGAQPPWSGQLRGF